MLPVSMVPVTSANNTTNKIMSDIFITKSTDCGHLGEPIGLGKTTDYYSDTISGLYSNLGI